MNDSKLLWKAIDYNGNINVLKSDDMRSQDIANIFEEKCKIDFKQTIFKDVTTDKIESHFTDYNATVDFIIEHYFRWWHE